ncbi:MAG TPA: hypothetical protein VK960_03550 [Acidimicrobiia bacterium]|nr:hypothetical protein [Acidimicrobiia bacterium]
MKRAAILIALVIVGCDSPTPAPPTTAPPGPTTTTTIEDDTCARLAADMADWFEILIEVLDEMDARDLADPERWPEPIVALQQEGDSLDARGAALECDPGALQADAFRRASLDPDSELARYLMGLLGLIEE